MSSRTVQIINDADSGPQGRRVSCDVDDVNAALVSIDAVHKNVHRGLLFTGSNTVLGLASGQDSDLLLVVPQEAHARFRINTSHECLVTFFEDSVATLDGTPMVVCNRNRNDADLPGLRAETHCAGSTREDA